MSLAEIKDQDAPVRLLRNMLRRNRVPNGLLFWGPGGVGKRLTAMALARALNCAAGGDDACGTCLSCRKVTSGNHPDVKVVALSMHSDENFVTEMLKAGASGYILKDSAFEELVNSIRSVLEGHTYLSPLVAGTVVSEYLELSKGNQPTAFTVLTDREREVLQLLAEGKSTKEIAGVLSVSAKTVDVHRSHIMDKLDLHSVAELTKYAIRTGLTSLET